ncbi:MAG: HAMP domain-containing methyl-accepting chemotaxis protein [Lachnospiraceae bacterium]|nr:HAMP domain-containing methyl-accepting chemotaxis protein [Lachnospiraceae bacterium]
MSKITEEMRVIKLRRMKIKNRIIMGYKWAIGLSIALVLIAVSSLFTNFQNFQKVVKGINVAEIAIKDCRIEANVAGRNIREMVLNTDSSTYADYEATIKQNEEAMLANMELIRSNYTEDAELTDAYAASVTEWIAIGDKILGTIQQGDTELAGQMILKECAPALLTLADRAKELNAQIDRKEADMVDTSFITVVLSAVLLILLLAFSVAVCVKFAKWITRSISDPLLQIQGVAEEMSKGNLKQHIEIEGQDEVAHVAQSLKDSIHILSGYVEDINHSMKKMADGDFRIEAEHEFIGDFVEIESSIVGFGKNMSEVLDKINTSADQVAGNAEQIAEGAEALTNGATDQASAIEELQATITDITDAVDKNAQNAMDASDTAGTVGNEVRMTNEHMQVMVQAMEEISQSSDEISKIIDTINEIAEQTNLLALNASIEAARAGEAGRGFSVVADQVGKLATESADAARNSAELIEHSLLSVKNGMQVAETTADQLKHSAKGTEELVGKISTISTACEQQAESLKQITQAVEQIGSVVEENTAMAEESSASSQEMATQADILKDLTGQFTLQ